MGFLKKNKTILMKKPSDEYVRNIYSGILKFEDIPHQTYYGYEMHDSLHHGGETTWSFPNGVREKILDDKIYDVWNICCDASDPYDTSVHHVVYYIEELINRY